MILRPALAAIAAATLLAPALPTPAAAQAMTVEPTGRIELSDMMGRWYEVARVPNQLQNGCTAGASDWTPQPQGQPQGFAVVQSCRKGGPDGKLAVWKARATVADPRTNAKIKMSFFGGVVSQDYVVVEHRREQGWLVLATANGKYLWLMSQRPTLPSGVKSQAVARIRQLGFDVGRLEFPSPGRF
ncbi:lipocalin family protein [Phenylobacterium sp.]|uniref:lipocalin family protein n=1 Tax=Phenylobacterium sp. TaxID=1871053 RepID=UPI00301E2A13